MIDVKQFIMSEFSYTAQEASAFVGSVTFTMQAKQMRKIALEANKDKGNAHALLSRIINAIPGISLEMAISVFEGWIKGTDDEFELELKREEEHEAQNSSDDEFEEDDPAKFTPTLEMLSEDQQKDFIRGLHSQYKPKRARVESPSRNRNLCR